MGFNNYDFLVDVNISSELIKPFCLWAIVKFRKDNYHTQNNSSRGDLIGGFLDRWINKIPEYFIFDELLNKFNKTNYSIINDYFFYYAESAKNAPDVLGLKKEEEGNIIIHKFATFNNDSWNIKKDAPLIEVKTFRQSQKLITIPKNQLEKNNPEDNHGNMFYAIVYADDKLNKNYLLNLLDNNIFDIKPLFYYNSGFIESDDLNLLDFPDKGIDEELIRINEDLSSENIGSYHLAGIYKWEDIEDYAICVGTDKDKPIKPFYLKSISDINKNIMEVSGEFKYFSDKLDCIPFLIIMERTSKCYLVSFGENSIILRVEGNVQLLNINEDYNMDNIFSLDSGVHEIKFNTEIINLTKYYTLCDSIELSSDFEKKEYVCELKSGIFNFYGDKFFNNIFDSKKFLDSDYKIINYSQEKIYFSNEKKIYFFEFNKGFKKEPEIKKSHPVKNILKEKMNDISINLNISVDSNSCCKIFSKTKESFIVSVEGNATISEVGDDNEYHLDEGFHQFDINKNKNAPHIKNCIKNIKLKNRDIKEELQLHNGFYLPESKNQNFTNVKLKVDYLSENSKIFIVKENNGAEKSFSIDIIVNGKVRIDGYIIEDYSKNYERQWKLNFEKFDRSSKDEEYIISRDSLLSSNIDSSNELIELFDKIVDQKLFID